MFLPNSPIGLVVDKLSASIHGAWMKFRSEKLSVSSEEEALFLRIAYQYLSLREPKIAKVERNEHLQRARSQYQAPLSADELYGSRKLPSRTQVIIDNALYAGIIVAGIAVGIACLLTFAFVLEQFLKNYRLIMEELLKFIVSGQALAFIVPLVAVVAFMWLIDRLRPVHEYVFAGHGLDHWLMYQAKTSAEVGSERAQILAMMGQNTGDNPSEVDEIAVSDLKIDQEGSGPVPIQPGVAEFALSTGRVKIDDLSNDFRNVKTQHAIVFWISFAVFIICIVSGLAASLFLRLDAKSIGVIGTIVGMLGVYSYKMLARSRLSRIALALFNSYVIELDERLEEAKNAKSDRDRKKASAEAWINFRVGLNKLYVLEERSGSHSAARERLRDPSA